MREAIVGERAVVAGVLGNCLLLNADNGETVFIECSSSGTALEGFHGYEGESVEIAETEEGKMIRGLI